MKKVIQKMVSGFGYRIEKKKALQPVDNDPRELPYLKNLPFSVMNLPTEKGVGLRFYPLTGATGHPFVLALKKASKEEDPQEHIFNMLKTDADLVTFHSANEFLGLGEEKVFPPDSNPLEFTYPWSALLPEHRKIYFLRQIVRREDARFWPAVQSGLFSEGNALALFDRMFNLESRAVARDWVDHVRKSYDDPAGRMKRTSVM